MSLNKADQDIIMEMISQRLRAAFEGYHRHCKYCGHGIVTIKEFSPDGPPYFFCNINHYNKFKKETKEVYRAAGPSEVAK